MPIKTAGVSYNLPGFDLAINYSNTNISPGGDGKESAVLFYRWQKLLEAGQTTMKLIEAIIKPFKLDDVREALTGIGPGPDRYRSARFCPAKGAKGNLPGG